MKLWWGQSEVKANINLIWLFAETTGLLSNLQSIYTKKAIIWQRMKPNNKRNPNNMNQRLRKEERTNHIPLRENLGWSSDLI